MKGIMSHSNALVKVEGPKTVAIILDNDFTKIGGEVYVDFGLRLNRRGSDFMLHANTGYEGNDQDTPLLASIVKALFGDDTGISGIAVRPFSIRVYANKTTNGKIVMERIIGAAEEIGYTVTDKPA
jgi:hypothetical protein